ncbi:hypothetical protein BD413DRAFT_59571 [Trametes elegans]|nr:hypothetical protein BD413DRAFT_59571 [Trametes elegans]
MMRVPPFVLPAPSPDVQCVFHRPARAFRSSNALHSPSRCVNTRASTSYAPSSRSRRSLHLSSLSHPVPYGHTSARRNALRARSRRPLARSLTLCSGHFSDSSTLLCVSRHPLMLVTIPALPIILLLVPICLSCASLPFVGPSVFNAAFILSPPLRAARPVYSQFRTLPRSLLTLSLPNDVRQAQYAAPPTLRSPRSLDPPTPSAAPPLSLRLCRAGVVDDDFMTLRVFGLLFVECHVRSRVCRVWPPISRYRVACGAGARASVPRRDAWMHLWGWVGSWFVWGREACVPSGHRATSTCQGLDRRITGCATETVLVETSYLPARSLCYAPFVTARRAPTPSHEWRSWRASAGLRGGFIVALGY